MNYNCIAGESPTSTGDKNNLISQTVKAEVLPYTVNRRLCFKSET